MNWIKKIKHLGQRIKINFKKKFPTKEEVENSDWTSCCTGPILKKIWRIIFGYVMLVESITE